jgi:hypothetical protein
MATTDLPLHSDFSDYVTMVDLSSELLGLSTLWLGADFFRTYSVGPPLD